MKPGLPPLWLWLPGVILVASQASRLDSAPPLEATPGPEPLDARTSGSTTFTTDFLTGAFNDGCTLSNGQTALDFDPDGASYLPVTRMLLAERAFDRFVLTFSAGEQAYTLANTGLPGSVEHHGTLEEATGEDEVIVRCTLAEGPLEYEQTARIRKDGTVLRMEIVLTNTGTDPLIGVTYFRAANPDPDLDNYGQGETADMVHESVFGEVAISSGPTTGSSIGAGVPNAVAQAGFCYRCADASFDPIDPEGRVEDWDLEVVVPVADIAPGYAQTFTFVYLLGTSPEQVAADWELVRDWDRDGWAGLDGDCDDGDPTIYPGATEQCNRIDEDCDGRIDNDTECFDDDLDGYSEQDGDCDDTLWSVHPGAPEGADTDGDGRPEGDGIDNDCDGTIDEGTDDFDDDGDGFSRQEGDCNDTAPAIHPGAEEIPYDGVDQDCDGEDLDDLDGDGDPAEEAGGGDCDDTDPARASTIEEQANEIDDDCDILIDEPFVQPGDVRFNEFMPDPGAVPDRQGEFIELLNLSSSPIHLDGWSLVSATGQRQTLDPANGTTRIPPGGLLTLGPNPDTSSNGGVLIDYLLATFALDNTGDTLTLFQQSSVIDEVAYGEEAGVPVYAGAALQRDPGCAASKSEPSSCWCPAPSPWADDSDRGSPGEPNPACAEDADGDGWGSLETGGLDCDDTDPDVFPGAPELLDGMDNDCDGVVDPGQEEPTPAPADSSTPPADADGDGFTVAEGDCDDRFDDVYPGAADLCGDGVDQDCSGEADQGCSSEGCGGCAATPARAMRDTSSGRGKAWWAGVLWAGALALARLRPRRR